MTVNVVLYNDRWFIHYKTNKAGMAQLISEDGTKFSGTPRPDKLLIVQAIKCKEFNHCWYFSIKQGIFSASTGNRIQHPQILELFEA